MKTNSTLEAALEQLRLDFIEGSLERLDGLEAIFTTLREHDDGFPETFQELQRQVHSLKGQGATFDFPSITQIAHRVEDFIESSPQIGDAELSTIELYLDRVRAILEAGENPSPAEMPALLRAGTLSADTVAGDQSRRVVDILLVMPKGLQRKIIAEELASCGFRLSMVDTPAEAITRAIGHRPDIVFATLEMAQMSGIELAQMLEIPKATTGCRFILLTSKENPGALTDQLPPHTVIVHKGPKFFEDLMQCLVDWQLFGDLAKSA